MGMGVTRVSGAVARRLGAGVVGVGVALLCLVSGTGVAGAQPATSAAVGGFPPAMWTHVPMRRWPA